MTTTDTRPAAISVAGLRKSYGDLVVLDGIDLEVPRGTVLALLGPNGSGKTTTVRILATLLAPDSGTAAVLGNDVRRAADEVRRVIGVTGQFSAVDELLTGRENLQLMADLHHLAGDAGRGRVDGLLAALDLGDAADRPAVTYSGGMRRRLDLAMTLVGTPAVVFLDEPTTGLDPRSRLAVWDSVRVLVDAGVTVFLTTQYLDEAERLADRVAVLDHGRVVAEGTPAELTRRVGSGHVELLFDDEPTLHTAAALVPTATAEAERLALRVPGGGVTALRELLVRLDAHGVPVADLHVHSPDLNDVFFAVTGASASDNHSEAQEDRR